MERSGIVTLLTDFGEEDWFVGSMKGVISAISPETRTIDITHRVPPGDIKRGALALRCSYRYFPRGTVHLAVVDPGVGSDRAVLVARGGGYVFVAPDNGLLSWVFGEMDEVDVFQAVRRDFFLKEVSDTFHGRDIFAPLAARLAAGTSVEDVGPPLAAPVLFTPPVARSTTGKRWEAEIIGRDRFGNCMTSLSREQVKENNIPPHQIRCRIDIHSQQITVPLVSSYNAVKTGNPLAIWGSCGFLELAVNGGDAAQQLGFTPGDKITIDFNPDYS